MYQFKKESIDDLSEDPTSREVDKVFNRISKKLKDGKKKQPMEKYLILFLFAGHGLLKQGMQEMVYNEFDNNTKFYKMYKAEKKLRLYAEIYPNAYVIGIFACCRQIWDHNWMQDQCVSLSDYKKLTCSEISQELVLSIHLDKLNKQ